MHISIKRRLLAVLWLVGAAAGQTFYFPAYSPITAGIRPLEQLSGDLFQIYNSAYDATQAYGQSTNALAMTNYGVALYDEGPWTLLPDGRMYTIAGDTVGVYRSNGKWLDYQTKTTCADDNHSISSGTFSCLGMKAIGIIPAVNGAPFDPYLCSGINGLNNALVNGIQTPTVDYTNCPTIAYVVNTSHTATQPKMATASMTGLSRTQNPPNLDETFGAGREIHSLFPVGTALYATANVAKQNRGGSSLIYFSETLWVKSVLTTPAIILTVTSEPAFAKIAPISAAPAIRSGQLSVTNGSKAVTVLSGDPFYSYMASPIPLVVEINSVEYMIAGVTGCATSCTGATLAVPYAGVTNTSPGVNFTIMQDQATNGGKFLLNSTEVVDVAALPWKSKLPAALQSVSKLLKVYGSTWAWRQSNLYLMVMDASAVDTATYSGGYGVNGAASGVNQGYYLTGYDPSGNPVWTLGAEQQAIPLLNSWNHNKNANNIKPDCIGEHSVRYSPGLDKEVLTYGSAECHGLQLRTAKYPWGPWSNEVQFMNNVQGQGWFGRLGYLNTPPPPNFQITLPKNAPVSAPAAAGGVATNVLWSASSPNSQMGFGTIQTPFAKPGNPYAPFQLPVEHVNADGTVMIFFTFSLFDPYVVNLATVTLAK